MLDKDMLFYINKTISVLGLDASSMSYSQIRCMDK